MDHWTDELKEILAQVISEENTDHLIELLLQKVDFPFWLPESLIKRILDQLLPERLLEALYALIDQLGEDDGE